MLNKAFHKFRYAGLFLSNSLNVDGLDLKMAHLKIGSSFRFYTNRFHSFLSFEAIFDNPTSNTSIGSGLVITYALI
jgi:hypothetical protein